MTVLSLHEAIEQLVNLGEKDPHEIAGKLRSRHGDGWMRAQAAALADDLAADIARRMLGSRRRGAHAAVPLPQRGSWSELLLTAKWVPNVGWKRIGDLTADDCDAVAGHYRMLLVTASRYASFFERLGELVRADAAETVSELSAIPQLELEAVA